MTSDTNKPSLKKNWPLLLAAGALVFAFIIWRGDYGNVGLLGAAALVFIAALASVAYFYIMSKTLRKRQ